LKQRQAFPEANNHVIGNKLLSGVMYAVETASYQFAEEKLGLKPITE